MQPLSDSFLYSLSIWLQWITIVGISLGLLAAIGILFVNKEISTRLGSRLSTTHSEATKAKTLANEVKLKQQSRILEQVQHKKIVSALSPIIGKLDLAIVYPSNDKEAELFAKQISSAFTEAGIHHLITWWTGSPLPIGVTILSRSKASDDKAFVISQAFKLSSLSAKYARGALIPEKSISVIIGSKE